MSFKNTMRLEKILKNWQIGKITKIKPVKNGIFNETYIVDATNAKYVLQFLHPLISGPGPTENYLKVTEFLRQNGMNVQTVMQSKSGKYVVKSRGRACRLLKAVPGKVYNVVKGEKMALEAGKELGAVHLALKNFKKKIKNPLPMFRYKEVLKNLRSHYGDIASSPDLRVKEAGFLLLRDLPRFILPANLPKRLIHTDPKISNFVFDENGNIISMIDFDTVQYLSPLYDIGDALRSFCGLEEDNQKNRFNKKIYRAFLDGYKKTSKKYLSKREWKFISQATAIVILGLAARFLNDYFEDFYFGWDNGRYKSRKEHNLARALGQISLYKNFAYKSFAARSQF